MARQTPDRPDEQLSALLSDIDTAVRARFGETPGHGEDRPRRPLLEAVVAALRRVVGAMGRARSPEEGSR